MLGSREKALAIMVDGVPEVYLPDECKNHDERLKELEFRVSELHRIVIVLRVLWCVLIFGVVFCYYYYLV
jgi:hypothetical protein